MYLQVMLVVFDKDGKVSSFALKFSNTSISKKTACNKCELLAKTASQKNTRHKSNLWHIQCRSSIFFDCATFLRPSRQPMCNLLTCQTKTSVSKTE